MYDQLINLRTMARIANMSTSKAYRLARARSFPFDIATKQGDVYVVGLHAFCSHVGICVTAIDPNIVDDN